VIIVDFLTIILICKNLCETFASGCFLIAVLPVGRQTGRREEGDTGNTSVRIAHPVKQQAVGE